MARRPEIVRLQCDVGHEHLIGVDQMHIVGTPCHWWHAGGEQLLYVAERAVNPMREPKHKTRNGYRVNGANGRFVWYGGDLLED